MTVSSPSSPHAASTTAKSRSACTVLVWKKEVADTWRLRPDLVEQHVHRLRLQEAALDVQDHVVPVCLVKADRREPAAAAHDRELHLVPVPVGVGRRQDGPELERAEPTDALETVTHLLFLEGELRGVRDVLESATAAATEVGARRLHPVGRGRLQGLDYRPPESRARLDHPHAYPVAGDRAAHENDVTLSPAHALAAEGEVVNRQIEDIAAPRFCHDSRHYIRVPSRSRGACVRGWMMDV